MAQHLILGLESYDFKISILTTTQLKSVWAHYNNYVKQRNTISFNLNDVKISFLKL